MIAENAGSVLKAMLAFKNGRWGDIPRHLGIDPRRGASKKASNKWLEFQYGWLPLMGTIYDGTELLKEGFRSGLPTFLAKSTVKETSQTQNSFSTTGTRTLTGHTRCKTQICYAIANATYDLVDRMGLTNPASVAWEAVPFSFVVDWFVPVGNTLSALTSTEGLKFMDGFQSQMYHCRQQDILPSWPTDPHLSLIKGAEYVSEEFWFERKVLTTFPRPKLYANMHPWNTTRVANALALLRQVMK
jgi:hypothetical protein